MSDDSPHSTILLVIFVALAALTAASAVTYDVPTSGTPSFTTGSGMVAELGYNAPIQTGNPTNGPNSITLRQVEMVSQSSGNTHVTLAANSSSWTNFSEISVSQANISLRPPNKTEMTVGGGIEGLNISNGLDYRNASGVDLVVDGRTSGTVSLDTNGRGVVAVDADTGDAIDQASVTASGRAILEFPSGSYDVDLQEAPSVLRFYNETSPTELIDDNVSLRVRAFNGTSGVFQQTVTDGTADLSNFPATDRLIVTIEGNTSQYNYRRAIIESITKQQEIYLLPESANSVDIDFALTDYSGNYPAGETLIFIEKPITKDFDADGTNETRYQTIAGDTVGPTGRFPATLEKNNRYRVRIAHEGNERILGGYTATFSGTEEITIRGVDLTPPEGQNYAVKLNVSRGSDGQRDLTWKYVDESTETTEVNFKLINLSSGNVEYQDSKSASVIQEFAVYDIPLTNDTSYAVEWNVTRDGETEGGRIPIGGGGFQVRIPLDPDWLGSSGVVMICFVAALAGARKHSYVAISVVGMTGVLMYLKAIDILVPMWFLAGLIAVGTHLRTMQEGQ